MHRTDIMLVDERKYKHEEGMTQENEMHLAREREKEHGDKGPREIEEWGTCKVEKECQLLAQKIKKNASTDPSITHIY